MIKGELYYRALDLVRGRKRDYQLTFNSPSANRVLIDLARFCRANESAFDADPRIHAALEGRREVWLRIQQHLGLTSEQLMQLYNGLSPIQPTETDDEN